jgi:RNA polymerase sigma factor (sigma-70 family)
VSASAVTLEGTTLTRTRLHAACCPPAPRGPGSPGPRLSPRRGLARIFLFRLARIPEAGGRKGSRGPRNAGTSRGYAPPMRPGTPDSDEGFAQVIQRARRRDPDAWTTIYNRYSVSIFNFFHYEVRNRQTAEDLTAGVFLEGLQAAHRFDGDEKALRAWLFRIGRHNLIDYIRSSRRAVLEDIETTSEKELAARTLANEDPEDAAMTILVQDRVRAAVHRLSRDQREVVLLRLTGGLTSPEIARIVGKTTGAVKALQHRAMATLAKSLADTGGMA